MGQNWFSFGGLVLVTDIAEVSGQQRVVRRSLSFLTNLPASKMYLEEKTKVSSQITAQTVHNKHQSQFMGDS